MADTINVFIDISMLCHKNTKLQFHRRWSKRVLVLLQYSLFVDKTKGEFYFGLVSSGGLVVKHPIQLFRKTCIGHYTRKSPGNTVILKLLTRDCSVKFSRMVAPGVIELVYCNTCGVLCAEEVV